MGSRTDAHCYSCGYDVELSIGGGMFTYQEFTNWPVHCSDCNSISSTNIRLESLSCSNCGSANVMEVQNSELYAGDGKHTSVTCWERKLTDGHYKCPKCDKFTLRYDTDFADRGPSIRWD